MLGTASVSLLRPMLSWWQTLGVLLRTPPSTRIRVAAALLVGVLAGTYVFNLRFGITDPYIAAGDVGWATNLMRDLLRGVDPYGYSITLTPMSYPLTAGIVTAPLLLFSPIMGAAVFIGSASALATFGLLRRGWWPLLALASYPYLKAVKTVQWSPLLLGITLFPALLPLTLAKPTVGLGIALTHLTRRRFIACAVLGLASLALLPDWPFRWLGHQAALGRYNWPLFTLPTGPLLLLALWKLGWRSRRAWFLILMAAVPQHPHGYDALVLWSLVTTPSGARIMFMGGWLGLYSLVLGNHFGGEWVGTAASAAAWYLPGLWCVLCEPEPKAE